MPFKPTPVRLLTLQVLIQASLFTVAQSWALAPGQTLVQRLHNLVIMICAVAVLVVEWNVASGAKWRRPPFAR